MKKYIKKTISGFVPKSIYKEQLKVLWYNVLSNNKVRYNLINKDSSFLYKTQYENLNLYIQMNHYIQLLQILIIISISIKLRQEI